MKVKFDRFWHLEITFRDVEYSDFKKIDKIVYILEEILGNHKNLARKIVHEQSVFQKIVSGVCLLSRLCLDFLSGSCLSRFCQLSGFSPDFEKKWLSAVHLSGFQKKAVRCLSVRSDKDETELSGISLSLFAEF